MVFHMKTTLNIDDTVMARLRREAARQNKTMSELVEAALRLLLQAKPARAKKSCHRCRRFTEANSSLISPIATPFTRQWKGAHYVTVIDTNILVYAANRDSEFHEVCRERIKTYCESASPWFLSWPICYEFLRVVTHPAIPTKSWTLGAAWHFLETIFDCPSVGILLPTGQHAAILGNYYCAAACRGNILHDVHTAALMREHGIREICTRDTHFHRFPNLTVIDPAK